MEKTKTLDHFFQVKPNKKVDLLYNVNFNNVYYLMKLSELDLIRCNVACKKALQKLRTLLIMDKEGSVY